MWTESCHIVTMRSLVFIAVLIAGAFSKPHGGEENEKIINGFACAKNSVPYQVSLRSSGKHYCGGALIDDLWVLTSAQCYKGNLQVVLGEHDTAYTENTEQFITVSKAARHPSFNPKTLDNDIMLIKLAKRATLNGYVSRVNLPSGCVGPNSYCQVSGWGIALNNGYNPASILQCLDSPPISHRQCSRYYLGKITDNMFCAGYVGESSTCKGDEGGPLVCQGQVQGIVSWGDQCEQENYPWVYTKVCNYVSWIQDFMRNN
ncbi:trypsin-like [Dendropsophus ebraccatus]|uniref:trypsin-like n=1 Tax=Dendropsophus ebraccatus TaxID=150705 RepID=UPI0038314D66